MMLLAEGPPLGLPAEGIRQQLLEKGELSRKMGEAGGALHPENILGDAPPGTKRG